LRLHDSNKYKSIGTVAIHVSGGEPVAASPTAVTATQKITATAAFRNVELNPVMVVASFHGFNQFISSKGTCYGVGK
jgi:hypothetical protein